MSKAIHYFLFLFFVDHALVRKWILLTAPEDKMAGAKVSGIINTSLERTDFLWLF